MKIRIYKHSQTLGLQEEIKLSEDQNKTAEIF